MAHDDHSAFAIHTSWPAPHVYEPDYVTFPQQLRPGLWGSVTQVRVSLRHS